MLFFFIMIYDSIRQAKPAIRNTFGAGRFNTRLSLHRSLTYPGHETGMSLVLVESVKLHPDTIKVE